MNKPKPKIFRLRERDRTVQIWRSSYPEGGQFNELLLEVKKEHREELGKLLLGEGPNE